VFQRAAIATQSLVQASGLRSVCKIGLVFCRLRVTEHNILVVAKYYSRIRMERLAMLLDLPAADSEKHLSDMVVAGHVTAKIDRPAGAWPPLLLCSVTIDNGGKQRFFEKGS
jgi:PCI domain